MLFKNVLLIKINYTSCIVFFHVFTITKYLEYKHNNE